MGKFGLSSGNIYIFNPRRNSSEWEGAMLSGFWVNKAFFITCAHAFRKMKPDSGEKERDCSSGGLEDGYERYVHLDRL